MRYNITSIAVPEIMQGLKVYWRLRFWNKARVANVRQPGLFITEGDGISSFNNMMNPIILKFRKVNPNVLNAKQIRVLVITKWLKIHNIREVQYLSGHRYISSTESYLQNDIKGLQEEVQQFHPLG